MKVNIFGRGCGWEDAPQGEYSWGITLVNLQRPVDVVIDMNVYEDGRWGALEKHSAIESRKLAEVYGVPYIDLGTYPINEIVGYFGTDYFSSTIDYALALAIYKGFKRIDLYGVNMLSGSEYAHQKAGANYWLGQAMGRGIQVVNHSKVSSLLRTKDGLMYGYDKPQRLNA